MASPYTSPDISGYNDNPPPDEGSTTEANRVKWSTIKTKLTDTIKTYAEAIDTAVTSAFTKIIGGGGVGSTAISYQVLSTDQGKLIRVTASGTTVTTPDATDVDDPFIFSVLNQSTGTVTLDGSGSQTINGSATVTLPPNGGATIWTDGTNWFAVGLTGTPVGKELHYGNIINGTITESNGSNAVTFALKTLAGTDPSTDDPVLLCFRNATLGTGNYVYRTVTSALSLTISSGSTLGTASGVAFKLWIELFDDGGTIRMGVINCVAGGATPTSIYPLGRAPRVSSTAEGGAGAADSAQVFYTGTAVTSKPYLILAYAAYESGMATAGSWNASPTTLQLFGQGVPLPGTVLQTAGNATGAVATGTTTVPNDDTIPQITEGTEFMTQAITPVSAANVLSIETQSIFANSAGSNHVIVALFQDATASALLATMELPGGANAPVAMYMSHTMLAATTSSTTFRVRAGPETAATVTLNGLSSARKLGGVMNSYMRVEELSA